MVFDLIGFICIDNVLMMDVLLAIGVQGKKNRQCIHNSVHHIPENAVNVYISKQPKCVNPKYESI